MGQVLGYVTRSGRNVRPYSRNGSLAMRHGLGRNRAMSSFTSGVSVRAALANSRPVSLGDRVSFYHQGKTVTGTYAGKTAGGRHRISRSNAGSVTLPNKRSFYKA